MEITESVKLYGTDEPVAPMQTLTAGILSVKFDRGALRYISIDAIEAIRNIDFVVRDRDWGTYATDISNLNITEHSDGFYITYDAHCGDDSQQLSYKVRITGKSNGTLEFVAQCCADTDFITNRAGFVVLHPINGVAGKPAKIEKVDGEIVASSFPDKIDPIQAHKDLRAITHQLRSGKSVRCEMNGDTFEMEDQRQWNDASFKTYVRPLSEPWPYTLPCAQVFEQSVTLTVPEDKQVKEIRTNTESKSTVITIGALQSTHVIPQIGVGLEPQHQQSALALSSHHVKQLNLDHIVNWHCIGQHDHMHLARANEVATKAEANLELQVVIPDKNYKAEIESLTLQCEQSDVNPSAVTVSPSMYLNSLMPTNPWPEVTNLSDIYEEVRQHFPDAKVGGGMLAFFPELNRHRPPVEHLDFVTHASNTTTHASDDITVTENLETLPHIIDSCRAFIQDKPYHLGPSSIAMRFNPYGANTVDNPDNNRLAMTRLDPRQRGLLNAAWTLGYIAHAARGQIDAVTLHALTGEFGVVYSHQSWSQPGFDDTDRIVFPAYHVMAGIANASGLTQYQTKSSNSREVEVLAYESAGKQHIWIANLTCNSQRIEIQGAIQHKMHIAAMSVQTWGSCTQDINGFAKTSQLRPATDLALEPYAVVWLSTP
jgi:hypothetical protein